MSLDFGNPTEELKSVARAMDLYSRSNPPSFILGLGDNFYPSGVLNVHDEKFRTFWSDIFFPYETLRVPWYIILGNHDYMGCPEAQINFTTSNLNVGGVWNMPNNFYKFSKSINDSFQVDFFALDTNASQRHVQRSHPQTIPNLQLQKHWLIDELQHSDARWKVVVGHHPMYTKGKGHGILIFI